MYYLSICQYADVGTDTDINISTSLNGMHISKLSISLLLSSLYCCCFPKGDPSANLKSFRTFPSRRLRGVLRLKSTTIILLITLKYQMNFIGYSILQHYCYEYPKPKITFNIHKYTPIF